MFVSKKAINTLIVAPLIGMTMLTAQPAFYSGDAAYAQNARQAAVEVNVNRPSPTRPSTPSRAGVNPSEPDRGSETSILRRSNRIPPCPPGAAPTRKCRPWTPPVIIAESKEDCQCKTRRVNGVMMKDCYVLVRDLVHYCKAGFLQRQ